MSAGWILTKPPKGKPLGFSARWAAMAGMSSALAPSSSSVVGMPRERKKLRSRPMPWRAVSAGSAKFISHPKTRTANWASRAGSWGSTYSIQAGSTTARPAPWAQS